MTKWGDTVEVSWNTLPAPTTVIERKVFVIHVKQCRNGVMRTSHGLPEEHFWWLFISKVGNTNVNFAGLCIWGGNQWTRFGKFAHQGVRKFEFSPCENYLTTFSNPTSSDSSTEAAPVKFDSIANDAECTLLGCENPKSLKEFCCSLLASLQAFIFLR